VSTAQEKKGRKQEKKERIRKKSPKFCNPTFYAMEFILCHHAINVPFGTENVGGGGGACFAKGKL